MMNASESFNVHKKASSHFDETMICSDVRAVHAFGPFPKWLYRRLYSSSTYNECAPHFAFGAVIEGGRRPLYRSAFSWNDVAPDVFPRC